MFDVLSILRYDVRRRAKKLYYKSENTHSFLFLPLFETSSECRNSTSRLILPKILNNINNLYPICGLDPQRFIASVDLTILLFNFTKKIYNFVKQKKLKVLARN